MWQYTTHNNHKNLGAKCSIQYSTVQFNTVQYSTVQFNTVQSSTVQYSAVQYSTVQYSTVQYSAVQYSAVQYSAVQCSTVQCSTVQCSSIQYSTVQFNTVKCSTVQCSTVQCSSIQYSAEQYGAVQYSIQSHVTYTVRVASTVPVIPETSALEALFVPGTYGTTDMVIMRMMIRNKEGKKWRVEVMRRRSNKVEGNWGEGIKRKRRDEPAKYSTRYNEDDTAQSLLQTNIALSPLKVLARYRGVVPALPQGCFYALTRHYCACRCSYVQTPCTYSERKCGERGREEGEREEAEREIC